MRAIANRPTRTRRQASAPASSSAASNMSCRARPAWNTPPTGCVGRLSFRFSRTCSTAEHALCGNEQHALWTRARCQQNLVRGNGGMPQANEELLGLRILVVEDNFLIAEELRDVLSRRGCEVVGPASRVEQGVH